MFNFKKYLAAALAILIGVVGFIFWHRHNNKTDVQNSTVVLQPNEEAKIIVDPVKRKLTVITPGHVKTTILPDRPSTFTLMKNDTVKVYSPQFGTEIRPFLTGIFTLNGGRLGGGVDLLYWKNADLGVGFATNPIYVQGTTAFVSVSYFVYSNTSLSLGIDNHVTPMLGIKVRL